MANIDAVSSIELNKLLSGVPLTSKKVSCKAPCDEYETATLKELINRYKSDKLGAGKEDAQQFLSDVCNKIEEPTDEQAPNTEQHNDKIEGLEKQPKIKTQRPNWRLHNLKAQNFKGLTEWNGDVFEINFDGKPHLIFGHNSTGKTSLLVSITWCLTGEYINNHPTNNSIEVYGCATEDKMITKWPGFVTLPHNYNSDELNSCLPTCFVECELKDEKNRVLLVKRTFNNGNLEQTILLDDTTTCFSDVDISALDLDISLRLPNRVNKYGTLSNETIADNLVSVAGLEALKIIGNMADGMGKSLALLKNTWVKEADADKSNARENISQVIKEIEGTDKEDITRNIDSDLKKLETEDDIEYQKRLCEEKSKAFDEKASDAFKNIINGLGIPEDTFTPSKREKYIKDIQDAQILIGTGADNWEIIQKWSQAPKNINIILGELKNIATNIADTLQQNYPMWKENKDQQGKLAVQISAASYLKQQTAYEMCPVCDQSLPEDKISLLKELSEKNRSTLRGLNDHLKDHIDSLTKKIPNEIQQLIDKDPKTQLLECINDKVKQLQRNIQQYNKCI